MAWNKLIKRENVRSIVDVRDDLYFRECDVDFLVENDDRQFTWVEVKTDTMAHRTGNLAYELTTSGNRGCLAKTKAKTVLYYLQGSDVMYAINMYQLRKYIAKNALKLVSMGDSATGYLIPIDKLITNKIAKEI